jgi:DNA-directed RNA polymerase specialized sigma24 family protein
MLYVSKELASCLHETARKALILLVGTDEAGTLASEAVLRCLQSWEREGKIADNPEACVYVAARHLGGNEARHVSNAIDRGELPEENRLADPKARSPLEELLQQEERCLLATRLNAILPTLKDDDRRLLYDRAIDKLSYARIIELRGLSCAMPALRKRYSRVCQRLRLLLAEFDPNPRFGFPA